jgi:sugar phosphate permease
MLSEAYPGLAPIYGIIASLTFSAAYSICNVFMSSISKKWNKRIMLAVGAFMFSASSIVAGCVDSLVIFAAMRVLFGMFASAINVPIYQLIASNFPIEQRSTANAIENTGYYIGAGLASLNVITIKQYGWRGMYKLMGTFGILIALACAVFIKNPSTQSTEDAKTNE